MYRVIQVSEGQLDGQTEGSGAISGYPATQSMTQVRDPGGSELGAIRGKRETTGWGETIYSETSRATLTQGTRFPCLAVSPSCPPGIEAAEVQQEDIPDCHWTLFSYSSSQAVIQGAFTSEDAVDTEGTAAETHYTYFPSTAVGDGAGGTTSGSTAAVVTTQGSEALLGQSTPPGTGELWHECAIWRRKDMWGLWAFTYDP